MKALRLFIISLLVITNATFAQSNTTSEKPASDFLMIQLGVDGWAGKPDSLRTTGIGRALNMIEGDEAKAEIHILCLDDTRDLDWVKGGLEEFDETKIKWLKV